MSTIKINGNTISGNLAGRNITINNGKVIIDGVDVTPDSKEINISITGNVSELKVDCCNKVEITGDVSQIHTQSGDVNCQNVNGSVQTMSGDVDCLDIKGSVSTMSGDIKHKKQ
jgi:DUF4097 and DUF4098 domain-containing protein YvlB